MGEADAAFAARRLQFHALWSLAVVAVGLLWWLLFPQFLVFDHGPVAFFLSVLVSLALIGFGIVFVIAFAMSLLICLWYMLERQIPKMESVRKTAITALESALLLAGIGYLSYVLYSVMTTGVVRSLGRSGSKPHQFTSDTDPLFFGIYVLLYVVLWVGLLAWLAIKVTRFRASR